MKRGLWLYATPFYLAGDKMSSWRLHLCQAVLGPKAELARKLQYIVTEVIYYKLLVVKLYILNDYPF